MLRMRAQNLLVVMKALFSQRRKQIRTYIISLGGTNLDFYVMTEYNGLKIKPFGSYAAAVDEAIQIRSQN